MVSTINFFSFNWLTAEKEIQLLFLVDSSKSSSLLLFIVNFGEIIELVRNDQNNPLVAGNLLLEKEIF